MCTTKWTIRTHMYMCKCIALESYTCFCLFCGSPNYVCFLKTFSLLVLILILVKKFISQQLIHGYRYCSINNPSKMRLLVSRAFWVKKESIVGQIILKRKTAYAWLELVSSILPHNHCIIRRTG